MAQQMSQGPFGTARAFAFEIQDPQKFAQNMARLVEETGKAVTAFVEPRITNPAQGFGVRRPRADNECVQPGATGLACPAAEVS